MLTPRWDTTVARPTRSSFIGDESRTVLVVDDDPDSRAFMAAALRTAGYCVDLADCAYSALMMTRERRPSAVVIDLMLPDMSGLELLRTLRTGGGLENVPVLVMTGRSEPEDRAAAEVLGIADYLVKPVEPEALVISLRRSLRQAPPPAFHSPLTKLPGSAALNDTLSKRLASDAAFAVLAMDIVDLDGINRRFGYKVGDLAILSLAAAMSVDAEGREPLFHIGGGEFVTLMPPDSVDRAVEGFQEFFALYREWLPGVQPDVAVGVDGSVDVSPPEVAAVAAVVARPRPGFDGRELRALIGRLMHTVKRRTTGRKYLKHVLD